MTNTDHSDSDENENHLTLPEANWGQKASAEIGFKKATETLRKKRRKGLDSGLW
jgi:hypothetical protein